MNTTVASFTCCEIRRALAAAPAGAQSAPTLTDVRAGTMLSTVNNGPVNEAKYSADVVLKLLAGKQVPKRVVTPAEVVTKANVDQAVENCTY